MKSFSMKKRFVVYSLGLLGAIFFLVPAQTANADMGSWNGGYQTDTTYYAATDGFVTATSLEGGDQDCNMIIESPVGTIRQWANPNHDGVQITETSPVKKGDSWMVRYPNTGCGSVANGLVKIYWIPFDGNLGAWSGKIPSDTINTAATDEFVLATFVQGGDVNCTISIETPIGTTRQRGNPNHDGIQVTEMSPVRKGEQWKVTTNSCGTGTTVYRIPFEGTLGNWSGPYNTDNTYSAATDGFVTATSMEGGDQDCRMQIESPVGVVRQTANPNHDGVQITETSPVKKGDSWMVRYPNTGCGSVANGLVKIYWIPYSPPTGTIIENATLDGKTWNSPPFAEVYDAPYGTNQTATLALPQTFTNMQTGVYTVKTITSPPGVTLKNINGSSLPYSATLSAGGTITVTYNFVTLPPPTGTLILKAYKDGVLWDAPAFTVSGSSPLGPTFILDFTADTEPIAGIETVLNVPTGVYTISTLIPPAVTPSVTLKDINGSPMPPSYSQTLSANGTITITFNFVTAVVPPKPVPTLVVSPSFGASVQVGGTQNFTAIYDPDGSGPEYPQYVTNSSGWSSSNNSVATINSIGSAEGKSAGSVTLTAAYSGLTASAPLTVTAPVYTPTLVVSPSYWPLAIGGTKLFRADYDPDGSAGPQPLQQGVSATWTSVDATKVTITPNGGLAERVGHGGTSITASYLGLSAPATVPDPAVLSVRPTPNDLIVGGFVQLNAYLDPDGSGPMQEEINPVTASSNWSSNRAFATMDPSVKGLVHAVNSGNNAKITANYQGITGNARANVAAAPLPTLSVSCSASPASAVTGQPVVWTATATGGSGSYSYSWSGSSPLGGRTGNPVTVTYSTAGTKTGSVTVTSGSQVVSQPCSTSVDIKNSLPLSVATLTATPPSINKGDSSTLTWTSTNNATRCDSPDFSTGGLPSNTGSDANPDVQTNPLADTTYHIYCINADGAVGPTASATVTVIPVTVSIKASPTCINGGGNSKISWSATPANLHCDVSGPGLSRTGLTGAQLISSQIVPITAKSTYTIACTTNAGSTVPSKSVIVDVSGCWGEF